MHPFHQCSLCVCLSVVTEDGDVHTCIKCVIYLTTLKVSVPNPQAYLKLDTEKQPKEIRRTPEQEGHGILYFSHSTHSKKAIITQGLKLSGHAVKRVLCAGMWTVSLPKHENRPPWGGGNNTAFPEHFPFQHQSYMNPGNLLDPYLNRYPQTPSLFPAGPLSALFPWHCHGARFLGSIMTMNLSPYVTHTLLRVSHT